MNQLKIHDVTDIAIKRLVFDYGNKTEFTKISITATDLSGTETEVCCFVTPEYTFEPGDIDITTRYIEAA